MNVASESYAIAQATIRARFLVTTAGYRPDEVEDARQDLLLDLLRRSRKFNGDRGGWNGFVHGVMRNHASVLARRRQIRTRHEVLASDFVPAQIDGIQDFLETVAVPDNTARFENAIDVRRAVQRLPDDLRALAYLLSHLRVTEVCRETGKSRSRVYEMIWEIRAAFLRAGVNLRPGLIPVQTHPANG